MSVSLMPSDSRLRPSTTTQYFGGMIERSTSTTCTFLADPSWSRYQHRLPTVIWDLVLSAMLPDATLNFMRAVDSFPAEVHREWP